MKQVMTGWQWHQLDHTQIVCTSFQTDSHAVSHHPEAIKLRKFTGSRVPSRIPLGSLRHYKRVLHYAWNRDCICDWNCDWNRHRPTLFHICLVLPIFRHSRTAYIEIAVFVPQLTVVDVSQNFSERAYCSMWKINHDFSNESRQAIDAVEQGSLNYSRVCSMPIAITISSTAEHPF